MVMTWKGIEKANLGAPEFVVGVVEDAEPVRVEVDACLGALDGVDVPVHVERVGTAAERQHREAQRYAHVSCVL